MLDDSTTTHTVSENSQIGFTVSATDSDSDDTLTLTNGTLPAGATFDVQTGAFSWTPTFYQDGSYTVTFTATDDASGRFGGTCFHLIIKCTR